MARWATWRSKNDFNYFCSWLITKDEADNKKKPWPEDLDYLKIIGEYLQATPILWIPKSRRMMLTWIVSAYLLWSAMNSDVFHGFLQSTKEEKADDILQHRIKFLWDHMPFWLKYMWFGGNTKAQFKYTRATLPNAAIIQAVAQGDDQFAQYTPSIIFVDEAAKQGGEFRAAYTTILPFVEKETQLIFVSSVEAGFFFETSMLQKRIDERLIVEPNTKLPLDRQRGMKYWKLPHGGEVLMVHYSVDPHKGPEWLTKMDRDVVGGIDGPQWRREMEIDGEALLGTLMYPMYVDKEPIVVKPRRIPQGARKWLACDYAYRNETAILWIYEDWDGVYYVYDEFYEKLMSIENIKRAVNLKTNTNGTDSFVRELIDPSTSAEREGNTQTQLALFNAGDHRRDFIKAKNDDGGIVLIRELLQRGRLKIFDTCVNVRFEFQHYRYEDWSDKLIDVKNPKEKPRKKWDHAMDALKYWANDIRYDIDREDEPEELQEEEIQAILDKYASNDYFINPSEAGPPAMTMEGIMNDV